MTTELKPCPFCGAEVSCTDQDCPLNTRATPSESMGLGGSCETTELLNDLRFRLENMLPDNCTDDALINRIIKRVDQLGATPSADPLAGLVRYANAGRSMFKHPDGEYVLHSEAAAIITQQNTSLQEWQNKWAQTDILRLKAVEQTANTEAPWRNMNSAPIDGTIINVLARYPDARSGYPRYAGFNADRGVWLEYSRYEPVVIIPWAWRPRLNWPSEGSVK